jgi:hypothetical protein
MDGFVPRSLDEALELRREHPEAVPVAGVERRCRRCPPNNRSPSTSESASGSKT